MCRKTYKVVLDLSRVLEKLSKFELEQYGQEFPVVFFEADNPDEASFKAYSDLFRTIIKQESSIKTKILCKECKAEIFISKIELQ